MITFSTVITLLALSTGLLITFILAVPVIWALFVWSRGIAHVERSRVAALMDVRCPTTPVPGSAGRVRRGVEHRPAVSE